MYLLNCVFIFIPFTTGKGYNLGYEIMTLSFDTNYYCDFSSRKEQLVW